GRVSSLRDPVLSVEELGLTPPQIHTVMWLGIDGAMSIGTVAERIHSPLSSMTGVIDRLERDQIVVRDRGSDDRRVVRIVLTETGQALYLKVRGALVARMDAILALLGK